MKVWYKIHSFFKIPEFLKMSVTAKKYCLSDLPFHYHKVQNNLCKIKLIRQAWIFYDSLREILS